MAYEGIMTAEKAYHDKYSTLADAPVEDTAFTAVSAALDRSNLLATRVEALADRLVGSVPQPVNSAEGRSGPGAVLPALRATANQTRSLVEDALSALDRIERALP